MTTTKALREMCETIMTRKAIHGSAMASNAEMRIIIPALLDRLSGEAVETRPTWTQINQLESVTGALAVKNGECILTGDQVRAVLALLPTGMDRNATIEECADRVENFSVMMKISDLSPAQWCEVLGRDLQIAQDVRSLKSS